MAIKKKARKAPESVHVEEGGGIMGLAVEMQNLAQEIANSFDARVARVAALRQETAAKLKGFQQEMKGVQHEIKRKAADLRRFLGDATSSRMRDFRAMEQNIRAGQAARSRQVGELLSGCRAMMSGFRRENQAAAGHWQSMAVALAKRRAGARS